MAQNYTEPRDRPLQKHISVFYWIAMPLSVGVCSFAVLIVSVIHFYQGLAARPSVHRTIPAGIPMYNAALTVEGLVCVVLFIIAAACLFVGVVFWKKRRRVSRLRS
jgi:nitrate reductase gamma subunit